MFIRATLHTRLLVKLIHFPKLQTSRMACGLCNPLWTLSGLGRTGLQAHPVRAYTQDMRTQPPVIHSQTASGIEWFEIEGMKRPNPNTKKTESTAPVAIRSLQVWRPFNSRSL